METEIKLGFIDKESLLAVADADWFRAYCIDNGDTSLLENTYLDTNDLKVTGNGAMIRVRHYSGDAKDYYEFTVKYGGGVSDGLHRRFEWNVKSDTDSFDVASKLLPKVRATQVIFLIKRLKELTAKNLPYCAGILLPGP